MAIELIDDQPIKQARSSNGAEYLNALRTMRVGQGLKLTPGVTKDGKTTDNSNALRRAFSDLIRASEQHVPSGKPFAELHLSKGEPQPGVSALYLRDGAGPRSGERHKKTKEVAEVTA